jgi:carbamoyl-phosphate synthase/aspartate carbamoyltransferase/dihydroorotase
MRVKLPGLVDAHVHLRVPGGEHKEDFRTGSAAALAGGFTILLAMPNTQPPLVTYQDWRIAQTRAKQESLCDVFLFSGASKDHIAHLPFLARESHALKVYLNETYGPLRVDGVGDLGKIVQAWPAGKPIAFHAEGDSVADAIEMSALYHQAVHICHVSRKTEIERIAGAKAAGLNVTCEVTPHHLFLTASDQKRLGPLAEVRPRLAAQEDVDALWDHINTTIDMVASDHAPHTLGEKGVSISAQDDNREGRPWHIDAHAINQHQDQEAPLPGIPGLESTLPLMLTAAAEGRITYERLVALLYTNPRRIYHLPEQPETWIEVDENARYRFPDHPLYTKCGWSPFEGHDMTGRLVCVVYQGREVYHDGRVLPNFPDPIKKRK